jgi:hypothetical protein
MTAGLSPYGRFGATFLAVSNQLEIAPDLMGAADVAVAIRAESQIVN